MLIVNAMNTFAEPNTPDIPTVLIPMMMLSILVLSVSIMGYLFVYEPVRLLIEGERQKALAFLAHTIGFFACYSVLFIIAFVYVSR